MEGGREEVVGDGVEERNSKSGLFKSLEGGGGEGGRRGWGGLDERIGNECEITSEMELGGSH